MLCFHVPLYMASSASSASPTRPRSTRARAHAQARAHMQGAHARPCVFILLDIMYHARLPASIEISIKPIQ